MDGLIVILLLIWITVIILGSYLDVELAEQAAKRDDILRVIEFKRGMEKAILWHDHADEYCKDASDRYQCIYDYINEK